MADVGKIAPYRRTAAGIDGDIVYQQLRCGGCQSFQTEPFDNEASLPAQVRAVSCLFCGRLGSMQCVRGN